MSAYSQILQSDEKLVHAELIALPLIDDIYLNWKELLLLQRGQNQEYNELGPYVYNKMNFSISQLTELANYLGKLEPYEQFETNPNKQYVEVILFLYSSSGRCYLLKCKICDKKLILDSNKAFKMKTDEYDFNEFFIKYIEDWRELYFILKD